MRKPTGKRPSRRRQTTPLDAPDERESSAITAPEEDTLEPQSENPTRTVDAQGRGSNEEIPLAEVLPDPAEDNGQTEEAVTVCFRRVPEEAAVRMVHPSSFHRDPAPSLQDPAFEADSGPGWNTDTIPTGDSPVPDSLLQEPAAFDLPLPPLPVMLFALILLALAV